MTRKKGRPVNFDVIVKFFMQHYEIPTRSDIDRLVRRLDHIEKLIKSAPGAAGKNRRGGAAKKAVGVRDAAATGATAADRVVEVLGRFPGGAGVAEIRDATGFDDKKIRNILYRQHKLGNIRRKGRGMYAVG